MGKGQISLKTGKEGKKKYQMFGLLHLGSKHQKGL